MRKFIDFLPHLNTNVIRALYLAVVWVVFKSCVDGMIFYFWGRSVTTVVISGSIVSLLGFGYVIWILMELMDKLKEISDEHRPAENDNRFRSGRRSTDLTA